jgi:hypothetical protein
MRRARRAAEKDEANEALEERAILFRRYRAARKAHRDTLYQTHPCGPDLAAFAARLRGFTQLTDAAAMLTYVSEAARSWLSIAPPEIRAEALSLVSERIVTIRVHAGFAPFDDPLPGEADDVFRLIKRELG